MAAGGTCLVVAPVCHQVVTRVLYHHGGAIKLTRTMQEREHTLKELRKMEQVSHHVDTLLQ